MGEIVNSLHFEHVMEHPETDLKVMHPTKAALVAEVVMRLDALQPHDIGVDEVLRTTGISRGSLYHHFENFEHLLETALTVRYASSIDQTVQAMQELVSRQLSKTDFLKHIEDLNRFVHTRERRNFRLERARILAAAEGKPRFEAIVGRESARLTAAVAAMVERAMELGYFQRQNDPKAVALLVQAYTLGRIVDDFNTEDPVDNDAWVELVGRILREILVEPDN